MKEQYFFHLYVYVYFQVSRNFKFFNTSDFQFENYYDIPEFYEVQTFEAWETKFETVKVLNTLFLVVSILFAVIDFLLLFSILSSRVRKESACWYLYHLNFVTILKVCFSLPRLEASIHQSFGACMFFTFTEWALTLTYVVNIVLMDIEILANIFASDPIWRNNTEKRFYISMAITWFSCILFSVIVMFFGHDEHSEFPVCFNVNRTAKILGYVMNTILPLIFTTSLMVAGVTLFIRSKRSPDNFKHVTQDKLQYFNEWFVCFMTWNSFVAVSEILGTNMHTYAADLDFVWAVGFQMAIFIIHCGLPIICLLLEPVRTTCGEWAIAVFKCIIMKRSCSADSSDSQVLIV